MANPKQLFLASALAVVVGAGFGFAKPPAAEAACYDEDSGDGCCSCDWQNWPWTGTYQNCTSYNCNCSSDSYCN